jgi:hypothetical protein
MTAPVPHRRQALIDRITGYVLALGLGDLTLRPLAKALGNLRPHARTPSSGAARRDRRPRPV